MNKKTVFVGILLFLLNSLCFGKPPVLITLTAPQDGTFVNKTVPIEAQIDQIPRVKSVKFYIDNKLVGESDTAPYQYTWDTTTYPDGQHQTYASILQAPERPEPFDEASMTVLDSPKTNLMVDNTPPEVSITVPLEASFITGSINTQAQVTDNLGILKVVFKLDSVLLKEFTQPPYNYQWDTKTTQDGLHTFEATAYDLANNETSSSVSFTVDNSPPTTPVVIDDGDYTNSLNTLHAGWSSEDPESGILEYQYSVGTTAGANDVINWVSAGTNTEISLTNLNLTHGKTYYFNVKAVNGVGLVSNIGSSDGIMVNAHIPQITRIIPSNDSTLYIGTDVTIEVSAQDLDSDPLEYQFSLGSQVKQPWSSLNTFSWTVQNSESNTQQFTIQVRDDKGGFVSENVNYNVQISAIDTTPPTTPIITVGETSNSLDSISASWISEDPESGIVEYQYAIGTTPGGTDVLYWTSYGANTEALIYGLNLSDGQNYYISVVAKNGAGLKSQATTSSAVRATKELYVKITSPQNNALITWRYGYPRISGIAEGVDRITINGKPVDVNPDRTFEGPALVAPGFAKWNNIADDDQHIIMNFPGPTTITASANGQEDTVTVYFYQTFVKCSAYSEGLSYPAFLEIRGWNSEALTECPFNEFYPTYPQHRIKNYQSQPWYQWQGDPILGAVQYFYRIETLSITHSDGSVDFLQGTCTSSLVIHTLPALNGSIKPMILLFYSCRLGLGGWQNGTWPDISAFKVNGKPLIPFYGDWNDPDPYAREYYRSRGIYAYVILDDYQPDTDLPLNIECPVFTASGSNWTYTYQGIGFASATLLTLETVKEMPYNSYNYFPVKTLPIFQPDDGKGRGPSTELVNTPFLKLKFNEAPSNSQANTLEAKLTIADETRTYNLTETSSASNIFTDANNSFTATAAFSNELNPNFQDETPCSVTSSFGNLTNKLFNLKESASDSLYFNDIKTFVTVIFNNELLPYQNDTLTIQYDNGMLASEEILTERSPDSLVFSNEDSSFTVNLNNYAGGLPDNLDITINNTDYLDISTARLQLPKVNTNPYVYTNEPMDEGSDLPPNNPLDDGQGVFRVRVRGLPFGAPVTITTDSESIVLNMYQGSDSFWSDKFVVLPEGDTKTYEGIIPLHSSSGEGKITTAVKSFFGNNVKENKNDISKGAFVGGYIHDPYFNSDLAGDSIKAIAKIFTEKLHYTTNIPDVRLTKQGVINALPKYSVWYSFTHGSTPSGDETTPFNRIKVAWTGFYFSTDDNTTHLDLTTDVYPNDIAAHIGDNSYKFVFLNGCLSADERPGSAADAFKSYFKAQEYLGWNVSVGVGGADNYAREFFNLLSENKKETGEPITVKQAYNKLVNLFIPSFGGIASGKDARYLGDGSINIHLDNNQ